jgi:glutamate transport system permease protein
VNSPLIFLVFVAYDGIPKLGALLTNFQCALIAVGLYLGGYISEALRSGFNAVANGQAEAARAIGLTFGQTLGHVILPQAVRSSVGPLAVLLNANYRNVAVAGIIGISDVVKAKSDLVDATASAYPFFIFAFGAFMVLGFTTAAFASWLDNRVAVKR